MLLGDGSEIVVRATRKDLFMGTTGCADHYLSHGLRV
jgi:hypothetical protein